MKNGVMDQSISNIAAQLLDEAPAPIRFYASLFIIVLLILLSSSRSHSRSHSRSGQGQGQGQDMVRS